MSAHTRHRLRPTIRATYKFHLRGLLKRSTFPGVQDNGDRRKDIRVKPAVVHDSHCGELMRCVMVAISRCWASTISVAARMASIL